MNKPQNLLIGIHELESQLDAADLVIIDCRFELGAPEAGYEAFLSAHIPSAVYANLERDLSGHSTTDEGRHPMPAMEYIGETFARLGVSNDKRVVLYDAQASMMAARAWWMLRRIGHNNVAILDGGWSAWCDAHLVTESGHREPAHGQLVLKVGDDKLVAYRALNDNTDLIDAREPRRYRGEFEPLDPRAGHIPGAQNHFFQNNLDESGRFLPPNQLREAFKESLGRLPDEQTVHYCGSGVSACHNIFSQLLAGLPEPKLYCGSWSEWSKLTPEHGESDESGQAK